MDSWSSMNVKQEIIKNKKRSDLDFSKVIIFVKQLPSFFSSRLTTWKYYRTNYNSSKRKIIKQFWDPFKGFLNFMQPIKDYDLKFKLFLEFIWIDFPVKKVQWLLKDLYDQNSITEEVWKSLKSFFI